MPGSILQGSLLLFGSGLTSRVLGFFYRIYLSRTLGAQGMGLLAMVGPVLGFAITVAVAGIPVALAKIVAERAALRPHTISTVMRISLIFVTFTGLTMVGLLLLFSHLISHHLLTDPRSSLALLFMSPLLLIIPWSAVLRGYFQGLRRMTAPAIAQILEQIVRILLVMWLMKLFLPRGLAWAAAGAAAGSAAGELLALLVLATAYMLGPKRPLSLPPSAAGFLEDAWSVTREILSIAVPVTITRLVASLTDLLDAAMIPRRLELGGFSRNQATAYLGSLSGMAIPLLFFPTVITLALAENLVPAISQALAQGNLRLVRRRAEKAMQVTFLVSLPTGVLFLLWGNTLGVLFYHQAAVGELITSLSLCGPFLYLDMTLTAILRGLGKATVPTINGLFGSALRLTMIYFLASLPSVGARAVIWGIAADLCLCFLLNLHSLAKEISIALDLKNWLLKPLLASGFMGLAMTLGHSALQGQHLSPWASLIGALTLGLCTYLGTLIAVGGFAGPQALF